jgi:hypothetical protein
MTAIAAEIATAVAQLRCGDVLQIEPDADETLCDLRDAVDHVALHIDVQIDSWSDPAEDYLYVRRC